MLRIRPEADRRPTKKLNPMIGVVIFGTAAVLCIISGAVGLIIGMSPSPMEEFLNGGPRSFKEYEGQFHSAGNYFVRIDHTISMIPSGKEYYYMVVSDDLNSAFVIRAPKGWYEKHGFNAAGYSQEGFTVKGRVRRMDYQVRGQLNEYLGILGEQPDFYIDRVYYIDTMWHLLVLRILEGVLLIPCTVVLRYVVKNEGWDRGEHVALSAVSAAIYLAALLLGCYLLSMT